MMTGMTQSISVKIQDSSVSGMVSYKAKIPGANGSHI